MSTPKMLYVTSRHKWRAWLANHYQSETEVWLLYYKKHTGRLRIPYEHAVEVALCFGWIDSIVKRVDDETFAQKFTPRRDHTNWSALNKQRVRKLIQEGRMTDAGLAKRDLAVPRFVKQALMASPKAWEYFRKLAPSYRRNCVAWIMDAKKEETRERRLREVVALLEKNKKLGLK
jgi:uncharacterized protein YdeI (YjbR/CyaY-like superfamily)